MFASRIAEAELKSAKCSRRKAAVTKPPTLERQVRGDAASLMRFLQRTIGNQATLRLLGRKTGNSTANHATESLASSLSWNVANILTFPLDHTERQQQASPLTDGFFPGVIQRKLEIGAVDDPLGREPDRVADQVMRMPGLVTAAPSAVTRALLQENRECSCGGSCEKCDGDTLDHEHERVQRKPDTPTEETKPSTGGSGSKKKANCASDYLVESWASDTCCTRVGFTDTGATTAKAGKDCCNKFPKFVDSQAVSLGFDGAASCRHGKFLNHRARVTSKDKSTTIDVLCVDTRADTDAHVIELGFNAAAKFKSGPLRESGQTVCIGDEKEATTCAFNTRCNDHPKEEDCLTPGCSKTATETKPVQKKRAQRRTLRT